MALNKKKQRYEAPPSPSAESFNRAPTPSFNPTSSLSQLYEQQRPMHYNQQSHHQSTAFEYTPLSRFHQNFQPIPPPSNPRVQSPSSVSQCQNQDYQELGATSMDQEYIHKYAIRPVKASNPKVSNSAQPPALNITPEQIMKHRKEKQEQQHHDL